MLDPHHPGHPRLQAELALTSMMQQHRATTAECLAWSELVSSADAAVFLKRSKRTLASWRSAGCGPRFERIGGRCVMYRLFDLETFSSERNDMIPIPGVGRSATGADAEAEADFAPANVRFFPVPTRTSTAHQMPVSLCL